MGKKVIVIGGSGGREHALAWKLSNSSRVEKVYIAPGNGGTQSIGENVPIQPSDTNKLIDFSKNKKIDLVIIGPDDLLAAGMADEFRKNGLLVFGASKQAARIESSKAFSKNMMDKYEIPTAKYETFNDAEYDDAIDYAKKQKYPLVVKASGLALGKGVLICKDFNEAKKAIKHIMIDKAFKSAGDTIIIEEFLSGSEVSFHALCDGENALVFPPSQDHKQVFDNDKGPNTGGMGAFGPVSWISEDVIKETGKTVIKPILTGLKQADKPFVGCLYPGLMVTSDGPRVLEYNARFGDPETQIYMRLLDSDLYDLLSSCAQGNLDSAAETKWKKGFAISVVLTSGGYPGKYQKGVEINGVSEAEKLDDVVIFHAGTKQTDGKLVTSGGRVMNVTATGESLEEAISKAYRAVNKISFQDMHYRKDIGRREVPKFIALD